MPLRGWPFRLTLSHNLLSSVQTLGNGLCWAPHEGQNFTWKATLSLRSPGAQAHFCCDKAHTPLGLSP